MNVLITSLSRKVPLVERFRGAIAALGEGGEVWGADLDPECVGRHFVDGFWEMPRLTQLTTEALIEGCRERGITLIVPTRDGELIWFAERRDALADAGIHVPIAAARDVTDCHDKMRFFERCVATGVPAIQTFKNVQAARRHPKLVVKERFGAGSRSIAIGLDADAAVAHAESLDDAVFQPVAEGVEHSVDLFVNRDGELIEVVPRVRRRVHAGESVVTETVEHAELTAASRDLAHAFNLRGHAVLQAFVESDGDVAFIECNPRVGGASALGFEAGCDTPRFALDRGSRRNGRTAPRHLRTRAAAGPLLRRPLRSTGAMIVVFDLDDTLYPEMGFVISGFRAVADWAASEWGVDAKEAYRVLDRSLRRDGRGAQFDRLLEHFGRRVTKTAIERMVRVYRHHEPELSLPGPHRDVLDALSDRPLYLVTDGHKVVQNAKIEALGIRPRFRHCYLTNRYGRKYQKPNPHVFELIRRREGVEPEEVVYVGDDPSKDFRGIRPRGYRTIRVRIGRCAGDEVAPEQDAECEVRRLSAVPRLIERFEREVR